MSRCLLALALLAPLGCLQSVGPAEGDGGGGGGGGELPIPERCAPACRAGTTCNASGECVTGCYVQPTCEQRACGADGCGGLCQSCPVGETCQAFKCDPGCGFELTVTRPDGERFVLRGHDAQLASCTRSTATPLISVTTFPRYFNGSAEGNAMVVFNSPQGFTANTSYTLDRTSTLRTLSVSFRGLAGWDGDYYSIGQDAGAVLKVGVWEQKPGGAFELSLEPASLVTNAVQPLRIEGRVVGRF